MDIRKISAIKQEDLKGKIIVGEYADREVDGFIKRYKALQERASARIKS